jgi:hypothetical protein
VHGGAEVGLESFCGKRKTEPAEWAGVSEYYCSAALQLDYSRLIKYKIMCLSLLWWRCCDLFTLPL